MSKPIKLFADGANVQEMYQLYVDSIVQGFTTNPTLMRKAGVMDYEIFARKVLELIPDMPISFEVFSDDLENMEREARLISSWGENIYVKIPVMNTHGESTLLLVKKLSDEGIKLNVTAIMTFEQVLVTVQALNTETPSIISVFAGRIADTGIDPTLIMRMCSVVVKQNKNTELLWASSREVLNIMQAYGCECDIITVTPDIIKKLPMLGKDLMQLSLETVQMFYNDAQSAGYKI
jgi:transaldolase